MPLVGKDMTFPTSGNPNVVATPQVEAMFRPRDSLTGGRIVSLLAMTCSHGFTLEVMIADSGDLPRG
jgi:hypothetical protein